MMTTLKTPTLNDLPPGIARDLEPRPDRVVGFRPGFLNWAAEEIEQLQDQSHHTMDRDERFRIQNRIATLATTANLYGEWLYREAEL